MDQESYIPLGQLNTTITKTSETPPPNNSSASQIERQGRPDDPILLLIKSGAIKLKPELIGKPVEPSGYFKKDGWWLEEVFYLDIETAIKTLESLPPTNPIPESQKEERAKQIVEAGKRALIENLKVFARNGDIPKDLIVKTASIIKPSDTVATPNNFARFLFIEDSFPKRGEERCSLEIGLPYLERKIVSLRQILEKRGIDISEEQIITLVLRYSTGHEYGHAIDTTLQISAWDKYKEDNQDNPNREKYRSNISEKMKSQVLENIAPNPDLEALLPSINAKPTPTFSNRSLSSSERIAAGFEYLSLKYALNETGIPAKTVNEIISDLHQLDAEELSECKEIIQLAQSNGLSFEALGMAVGQIMIALRKQGRDDLRNIIGFNFTSRTLGHYYPLSEEELQKYITTYWPPDSSLFS